MNQEIRVLRINEVADKLSIGQSTIYDWLNPKSPRYDASFPKPVKLGTNSNGWLSILVDKWLLNKYREQQNVDIADILMEAES